MKIVSTLIVITSLYGCAGATKKAVFLPDGSKGYAIACSGGKLDWTDCADIASKLCKSQGYKIISNDTEQSSSFGASQIGAYGSTHTKRTALIKCN